MAIERRVHTEVHCDICGKYIAGWLDCRGYGVSRDRAAKYAREEGCTTGKKIVCKKCRIRERIKKCSLIKKMGEPGKDGDTCLGFANVIGDEPIEQCKRCIACSSFDWDEIK